MLPMYFGLLCDLVTDLGTLEDAMPPSVYQYRLHALVHRFDKALDLIAELALLEQADNDRPRAMPQEDHAR